MINSMEKMYNKQNNLKNNIKEIAEYMHFLEEEKRISAEIDSNMHIIQVLESKNLYLMDRLLQMKKEFLPDV